VYGIGMKRAVFKIGNSINIRSTYKNKGKKLDSFSVPIDVTDWLGKDDKASWDFDIAPAQPLDSAGVEVTVTDLNSEIVTCSPSCPRS
jgi:hypothetical protein